MNNLFMNEHPQISQIINNAKRIQNLKQSLEEKSNIELFQSFLETNYNNNISSSSTQNSTTTTTTTTNFQLLLSCYQAIQSFKQSYQVDQPSSNFQRAKEIAVLYLLRNQSPNYIGVIDSGVLNTLRTLLNILHPNGEFDQSKSSSSSSLFSNSSDGGLFGNDKFEEGLFSSIKKDNNTNSNNNNNTSQTTTNVKNPGINSINLEFNPQHNFFDKLEEYILYKLEPEYNKLLNKDKVRPLLSTSSSPPKINNNPTTNTDNNANNYTNNLARSGRFFSNNNSIDAYLPVPKQIIIELPGETIEFENYPVNYIDNFTGESIPCFLFVTTFKLVFVARVTHSVIQSIPLFTIYGIDRVNNFKVDQSIQISAKDFRRVEFYIMPREIPFSIYHHQTSSAIASQTPSSSSSSSGQQADYLYTSNTQGDYTAPLINRLRSFAFQDPTHFAIKHCKASPQIPAPKDPVKANDGWMIYREFQEYMRMGILSQDGKNQSWRVSFVNAEYINPTYPQYLVVPNEITEEEVAISMNFRSKGRIPTLSWISPSGVPLARSSQPMVGITRQKCTVDEKLVNKIRDASPSKQTLYLLDARPKANAIANVAKGMGYELNYNCNIEFLGIANIHSMRDSINKLESFCHQSNHTENWLSGLEQTKWFDHLQTVIIGARRIAELITQEHPVLLHCSDGWDRTSQISSLSMILMDPYYRTIYGFMLLIEKEWLTFGHCFQNRVRHGDRNCYGDSQRSPIFLQFIDCVYQFLNQYPHLFEFNEDFLIKILDSLYSCQYGTFLCNNEKERKAIKKSTLSLWTHLLTIQDQFLNVFYDPNNKQILIPDCKSENFSLWKNYYLRYWRNPNQRNKTVDYQKLATDLMIQNRDLLKRVQELEEQNKRKQLEEGSEKFLDSIFINNNSNNNNINNSNGITTTTTNGTNGIGTSDDKVSSSLSNSSSNNNDTTTLKNSNNTELKNSSSSESILDEKRSTQQLNDNNDENQM
eukprot:gene5536-6895_t